MSLTVYTIEELLTLQPPQWLIDNVIPVNGLTALYGEPGDGKTFIALDMALSVASGLPWQGHPVRKGFVVYISAEGGAGIGKRVAAWLKHHQAEPGQFLASFVVCAVQVHPDSDDIDNVIHKTLYRQEYQEFLANALEPDEPPPPLFVIVDTLARCFVGDENQQEDMGNFIRGLDYLREEHGATVLVVHHTNKNGFEERGSSAFRGACDTMIQLTWSDKGDRQMRCSKQKDAEEFKTLTWDLTPVKGSEPEMDSCVVETIPTRRERQIEQLVEYTNNHPHATQDEIARHIGVSQPTISKWQASVKGKNNSLV